MRCSVLYIDHTAMGGNNGTAQGQPKTQPAAAIAAGFAKGIKHIKQLVPAFFRDAGAVIRYADADKFALRRGGKLDAGMLRGIFDGVVDEVHQHLLDQLGVHIGHQQVIRHVGHNGVAGGVIV